MFDVVLTVKYMYRTRKGRVCSTDFRTEKKMKTLLSIYKASVYKGT